jgi:predicted ABC-type ATPase
MAARKRRKPRCIIIAGPNGAGKTTFAKKYLPNVAGLVHFINAELIASGISPFQPELAAVAASRLVLRELDRLTEERTEFAFEDYT